MNVLMPQLGETVEDGTVIAWLKAPGDVVAEGEPLFEVETDKVTLAVPAPADGVLAEILVAAGKTVKVGSPLAVISAQRSQVTAAAEPPPERAPARSVEKSAAPLVTRRGRVSPVVRRLMAAHALRPEEIVGTGGNGRVTRSDVLGYIAGQQSPVERLPFTSVRKRIAEHMVRSKATSPHVLQAIEVDFREIDRIREQHADEWKQQEGFSLTYLPFVAHAVCEALRAFPRLNGTVEDDALLLHGEINLAIAVDLSQEGLVAPVIKRAASMTVRELACAIHSLAIRARSNQLTPDDLSMATYTISNSGSFGTLITAPIINQPQVAILSMDGIRRKPVVIERDGAARIGIRPIGVLAQSFDHRALDGAYSAAFLRLLRETIESNTWTLDQQ